MVQTRFAAQRIESEKRNVKDGKLQEVSTVGPVTGNRNGCSSPKKSRQDDTTTLKKRRRGGPSELCRLNLDVLFLIAAHIHPIDLLNLARTCRSLRELLMDKSSTFVWKTAFQQVDGLPACPADMTEPEYANLVFFARCHGCGKYTKTILWKVRRRYCPSCRVRRLRRISSCNEVIRKNKVLPVEYITVKKETSERVDRDHAASFMDEYRQTSDKQQLIAEKQTQRGAILKHAQECEAWQKIRDLQRKVDTKELYRMRYESIFHRLELQGYSREIGYFGDDRIRRSCESIFRTSKPLTDKEWGRTWPKWVEIMNNFRSRRLEHNFYEPRRRALVSAYTRFLKDLSPDAPVMDIFPHVADLVRFRAFVDMIEAPEETSVNDTSFAPALAQLPVLAAGWKKQLDADIAGLVKIPHRLSPRNASGSRMLGSAPLDRLRLASALFQTTYEGIFTYLEALSVSMLGCKDVHGGDSDHLESTSDRLGIYFFEEAPYIVRACGLDPNVATAEEMDLRNARVMCLACEGPVLIMNWRRAMRHACSCHQKSQALAPLSKAPRWQLFGDEHIDAIRPVEQLIEGDPPPGPMRCLSCRHHVGDAKRNVHEFLNHMYYSHHKRMAGEIEQGVHYAPIGIFNSQLGAVEMVEEGKHVTFKVAKCHSETSVA